MRAGAQTPHRYSAASGRSPRPGCRLRCDAPGAAGARWGRGRRWITARPTDQRQGLRTARARPLSPVECISLTFSWAAMAEAPQGRADVLDVKGEDNFTLRYFIHSETRLPIMVTWNTPPTNVIVTVPGQPPPSTVAPGAVVVTGPPAPAKDAPKEEMDKYTKEVLALRAKAQATSVEHRQYFADYRDVDGLKLRSGAPRDREEKKPTFAGLAVRGTPTE